MSTNDQQPAISGITGDGEKIHPKVFISYSWSSSDHQSRILEWAQRLVGDGVDVRLDKWHLKEGQDKYHFMEQMVTDPEISKVLVFSDRAYAEKADARKGGVGTESQIISREVYEKVAQEKFLPIVCERDESGEAFLPTFLKNRIYFDFSNPETYHENYERLVRAIYGKPLHKRPELGKAPEYILSEEAKHVWSRPLLQGFKDAVLQDRKSASGHAVAFLNTFFERLEEFRVTPQDGKQLDDLIVSSIDSFLPFRDCFVEFLDVVVVYRSEAELYDRVAAFFEHSIRYKFPSKEMTQWNEVWFDNFDFVLYELFLYLVALMIKHDRLVDLKRFLDRLYLLPETANARETPFTRFVTFCAYCESLSARNQRLKLNRLNPIADLMKQRATLKIVPWQDVMQAEGVLFLKSLLLNDLDRPWYPHTLVYAGYAKTLQLFIRAREKGEFQKLKALLGVASKQELITKFNEAYQGHRVDRWSEFSFQARVSFQSLLGLEHLDSVG